MDEKHKLLGKFWENFESFWWNFYRKIEFLFLFFKNLLLKIELSKITPFFYKRFFGFGGGDFPHPLPAAYALAWNTDYFIGERFFGKIESEVNHTNAFDESSDNPSCVQIIGSDGARSNLRLVGRSIIGPFIIPLAGKGFVLRSNWLSTRYRRNNRVLWRLAKYFCNVRVFHNEDFLRFRQFLSKYKTTMFSWNTSNISLGNAVCCRSWAKYSLRFASLTKKITQNIQLSLLNSLKSLANTNAWLLRANRKCPSNRDEVIINDADVRAVSRAGHFIVPFIVLDAMIIECGRADRWWTWKGWAFVGNDWDRAIHFCTDIRMWFLWMELQVLLLLREFTNEIALFITKCTFIYVFIWCKVWLKIRYTPEKIEIWKIELTKFLCWI